MINLMKFIFLYLSVSSGQPPLWSLWIIHHPPSEVFKSEWTLGKPNGQVAFWEVQDPWYVAKSSRISSHFCNTYGQTKKMVLCTKNQRTPNFKPPPITMFWKQYMCKNPSPQLFSVPKSPSVCKRSVNMKRQFQGWNVFLLKLDKLNTLNTDLAHFL